MPNLTNPTPHEAIQGIRVLAPTSSDQTRSMEQVLQRLGQLSLLDWARASEISDSRGTGMRFEMPVALADDLSPHRDTTRLCERLGLAAHSNDDDLEREIWLAMLQCPIEFVFPSVAELLSSIRMRQRIVTAARKTALAFATSSAERPEDYWHYDEDAGFIVRPGMPLIDALEKATQPERSGMLYSFSCYRATEYVMALAIAHEAAVVNPPLLDRLQRQAERRAIRSGEFHRVFCIEHGSRDNPLPKQYFVPGDRTWFRNPDAHSSDASGFEGSWVFYVGHDSFTNFWKRDEVFTLTSKCLEIFHWRHGTYRDEAGLLRMNEDIVAERVEETLRNPTELSRVMELMLRISDGPGIYADGGCVDISREYPRWVCPGTSDIELPEGD